MKAIKLKHYRQSGKDYLVTLGNGHTAQFSTLKSVRKYLVDTNRYLNFKLHEMNYILADLQRQYRRNWFYFDHNKNSEKANLYGMDRRCQNNFSRIAETFDLIIERSSFENGNQFVFTHFNNLFQRCREIAGDLQSLQRSKSNAVDVYELQVILERIRSVERDLKSYTGDEIEEITTAENLSARSRMKAIK